MHASPVLRPVLAVAFAACSALAFAQAQKAPAPFEPSVGQDGKDVVWVPTSEALVEKMLEMAKVDARDFVMDLGSGDGRTVIAAARRGAQAMGVEYDPEMVALSRQNAEKAGVQKRATFVKADLFETDLSKASVITMFLLPEINLKLRPKILALKPGTRVVSNTFKMDQWQPDETGTVADCTTSWCTALLWIVPARVVGSYDTPQGRLVLKQDFQMLSGTLRTGGKTFALQGRVRGEDATFSAGGRTYQARLNGKQLELR